MKVKVVLADTERSILDNIVVEDPYIEVHERENGKLEICVGSPVLKEHPRVKGMMASTWPRRIIVNAGQWVWYSQED